MDETSFSRKLSLSDVSYAASGYRQHHDHQLVCQLVVQGQGRIAEPALLQAVQEVARFCPAARVRLRGWWVAKRWSACGPLPRVRVVQREWDGLYHPGLDFIDTSLDLIAGPVAEVVQVVGRSTYLVFRAHHAVMDGVGLMDFARALFKLLNGIEPERYDSKVRLEDLPPGNVAAIPSPVSQAQIPFVPQAAAALDRSRLWRRVSLPGTDNKILLKTMLALSRLAGDDPVSPVRIHMPVSLRRHIRQERSLSNLIGMLRMDIDVADDCKAVVRKIKQAMGEQQELPVAVNSITSKLAFAVPLMVLHCLQSLVIRSVLQRPRFRCSATTSHIGFVDLQACSTATFAAHTVFGIPVPPLGTPVMVVMMTNQHSTEMVVSVNRTLLNDEGADALVARLRALIEQYGERRMERHKKIAV